MVHLLQDLPEVGHGGGGFVVERFVLGQLAEGALAGVDLVDDGLAPPYGHASICLASIRASWMSAEALWRLVDGGVGGSCRRLSSLISLPTVPWPPAIWAETMCDVARGWR